MLTTTGTESTTTTALKRNDEKIALCVVYFPVHSTHRRKFQFVINQRTIYLTMNSIDFTLVLSLKWRSDYSLSSCSSSLLFSAVRLTLGTIELIYLNVIALSRMPIKNDFVGVRRRLCSSRTDELSLVHVYEKLCEKNDRTKDEN